MVVRQKVTCYLHPLHASLALSCILITNGPGRQAARLSPVREMYEPCGKCMQLQHGAWLGAP